MVIIPLLERTKINKNKKVIARRRSGNLRSNGTQAEDGRGSEVAVPNGRQRQPLGQIHAHPFILIDQFYLSYKVKYVESTESMLSGSES